MGVDAVNPTNNYFYAEVNKFTLGAVVDAFGLNIQLPKALMESGFPDGVIVSFTTNPKGMRYSSIKVFQGAEKSEIIKYSEHF